MQAARNADEPRKLNIPSNEGLSLAELETVPLKKRLEILFISNIIPSRRQLAFKYGLDEQLIHNVLSHRTYILQNWKYNPNAEHLLSKLELENAMAIMELLIEWKRRVQLSGLQMTHAALLRKTLALQKILKANTLSLCDNWWQLFNENWERKKFRDSEDDSLEFEDILTGLQWMFTKNTFNRLAVRLRRARSGGRTHIKRETTKGENDVFCLDGEDDSNELNEMLDVSEIKAEPLYYNDDDFDCEDYEFVLDEELVLDSLRRELADAETAKYQHYMVIDNAELLFKAEKQKPEETEEFIDVDNDEIETKTDLAFKELQESSNCFSNTLTPADSIDPIWSMIDRKVPVPVRLKIVKPVTTPMVIETPKVTPKRPRRKPRDVHTVLTVRKDCVRLPALAEVANFATKKFIPQKNGEDTNESEENGDLLVPTTTRKQRNQSKVSTQKRSVRSRSPSPRVNTVFEDVDDTSNKRIIDTVGRLNTPIPSSDEAIVESSTTPPKTSPQDSSYLLKTEPVSASCVPEKAMLSTPIDQRTKDLNNKQNKRSNYKTDLKNFKVDDEGESVLGICSSFSQSEEGSQPESSTSQELTGDRRKQKFKDKLKITSVQILDATVSKDDETAGARMSQVQLQPKLEKNSKPEEKSPQKNQIKNAVKRVRRRTDDSDLTLRKDKVRISLATVAVAHKQAEENSQ